MLNDIVNRITILEDALKDRSFRKKAELFFDKLELHLLSRESFVKGGGFKKLSDVNVQATEIDKKYKNLFIVIKPVSTTKKLLSGTQGILSFGKTNPALRTIKIKMVVGKSDTGFTKESISLSKGFFVHEFTHYLDSLRIAQKVFSLSTKRNKGVAKGRGWNTYANDNLEMNAFYQQATSGLENLIKVMASGTPEQVEFYKSNFLETVFNKDLIKFSLIVFKEDATFFGSLTPDNRKRILKRLAGFQSYIRKTYSKLIG